MVKGIVFLVLLAAAAGTAWYVWPADKAGNGPRTETKRVKVERGNIAILVTANGEIKPVREVELKSKASGQVMRFPKDPGDAVEAGELIAELDKKTELRNLQREEANLSSAEASLELTRLEYARSLKQSESELAAVREDEKQKKAELDRLVKLTGDLITQSELGNAQLAARLVEEKVKQAEAALALIRGRKEADEKLSTASVQKARVSMEDAKDRLADTEVRSPMKGILLTKLVEEGQIVASGISASTGGTAIARVADVSTLFVEANIDETDIAKVRKGLPADIALQSGSSERFKGTVDLIPPKGELDSNVIVFKVRVAMEGNVFGRAFVGMTASVTLRVEERKGTLLVPSEAVKMEKGKPVVHVPDGAGSKPISVTTGLDNGMKTEILTGLDENAEVIVTLTTLPDGRSGGRSRMRF